MKLPADDPRRRYLIVVNGSVKRRGPWSTIQMMAKHMLDNGQPFTLAKIKEEQ